MGPPRRRARAPVPLIASSTRSMQPDPGARRHRDLALVTDDVVGPQQCSDRVLQTTSGAPGCRGGPRTSVGEAVRDREVSGVPAGGHAPAPIPVLVSAPAAASPVHPSCRRRVLRVIRPRPWSLRSPSSCRPSRARARRRPGVSRACARRMRAVASIAGLQPRRVTQRDPGDTAVSSTRCSAGRRPGRGRDRGRSRSTTLERAPVANSPIPTAPGVLVGDRPTMSSWQRRRSNPRLTVLLGGLGRLLEAREAGIARRQHRPDVDHQLCGRRGFR